MKCSVELPIAHLDLYDQFDYDFVIASTCVSHPEYFEFYKNVPKDRFMILDNGAFELGESISDYDYLKIAKALQPNVVVIPDVLRNPRKTLDRFRSFMSVWVTNSLIFPTTQLMGVIQANGSMDVAHTLGAFYEAHDIPWIGVPYVSDVDRIALIKSHPEWENVHILGLPVASDILTLCTLPNVKTIDSSLPVKVTKRGEEINLTSQAGIGDGVYPDDVIENVYLLRYNLKRFFRYCN